MKDQFKHFDDACVLITGGLGFIGSNLSRRLVALGAHVTVIDNILPESGGNIFNISGIEDKVQVNISDIRDTNSIDHLINGKDYLFNLAGQTSHMDSMKNPYDDLDINVRAQLSILEICKKYNPDIRIIYTSTRQIYGRPDYLPADEKCLVRPVDVNGINKAAGEYYHILYNHVYGIRSCVLRLTNTYGPGMRVKDAHQNFIGYWLRLLLEGKSFEVWGGDQIRDYSYVDDVVDALLRVAIEDKAYGETFNLGDNTQISLKQLADILLQVNNGGEYTIHPFPNDRKKIDIGDCYSDWTKLHELSGWQPGVDLTDGLKRTLEYYRNNLQHYI